MTRSAILLLTLSRLGPPLDRHLALAIHISPNNGPMDMIPSAKLVVDVLAVIRSDFMPHIVL